MFERVELERELAKKKKNEEEKKPERPRVNLDENEDLEKEFGANIIEMSEVEWIFTQYQFRQDIIY